jgi:uncharacterized membrane protein
MLYIAAGLLLIGLALPLVFRKIPPNHWYGFRVKRTLEDREVWFAANAFAGRRLAWTGLATVAAAVAFHLLPINKAETYAVAVAAVMLFSLTVAVVQSFRYLYGELPESGDPSPTGEHANEIEKL